jgi:hypothetical protein
MKAIATVPTVNANRLRRGGGKSRGTTSMGSVSSVVTTQPQCHFSSFAAPLVLSKQEAPPVDNNN